MPRGNPHLASYRAPLPNGPGHGRPKGSKNKLTKERVERELRYIALSNIARVFEGVHGSRRSFTLREIKAMPEEMQRAIASVKVRTENLTAGDDRQDTTVEIKLWDKTRALEMCGRALGMFKDRQELEIKSDAELIAALQAGRKRTAEARGERG